MPNGRLLPAKTEHVTAYSTTNAYVPMTEWMPAMGIDKCKAVTRNSNTTFLTTQIAYQVAEIRTDWPSGWNTFDAARAGDGDWCTQMQTISGGTATMYWVRFGIAYKATSGSFGEGDVYCQISVDDWGTQVGEKTFQAASETATSQYEAFTPWLPAQFADKVKLAIRTSAFTNITVQPAYQTAETLTSAADGWTTFDSAITGTDEVCTGEDAPTLTGKMWVRFGFEYHRTTGSPTRGECQIAASISIRTV